MHDALVAHPRELRPEQILVYAKKAGLQMSRFRSCLKSKQHEAEITKDIATASGLSITGTPSFVIGRSSGDKFTGLVLPGAFPYSAFEDVLRKALRTPAYTSLPKNDRIIEDANVVLATDPRNVRAHIDRGMAYREKGDSDRALSDLDEAVNLAPQDGEGYVERGRTRIMRGEYDDALVNLNKASEADGQNWEAYYLRGLVYQVTNRKGRSNS